MIFTHHSQQLLQPRCLLTKYIDKIKNCLNLRQFFVDLLTTARAVIFLRLLIIHKSAAAKLTYRECDTLKERAGIIIICGIGTFLIRNAVIGCVYKKLCGSHNSYNREYTERNVNSVALAVQYELIAKRVFNTLGDIVVFCRCTRAGTVAIRNLSSKDYRLYCFNNGLGVVCANGIEVVYSTISVFG